MEFVALRCDWCGSPGIIYANRAGRRSCSCCLILLMGKYDDIKKVEEFSDEGAGLSCEKNGIEQQAPVAHLSGPAEDDNETNEDPGHEVDGEEREQGEQ